MMSGLRVRLFGRDIIGGDNGPSFLRLNIMCRLGLCETFGTEGDDTHLWGECCICGKRAGMISREAVRRYAEAQESTEAFMARMQAKEKRP